MFYDLNPKNEDQTNVEVTRKEYKKLLTDKDPAKTESLAMLLSKNERMKGHY